MNEFVHFTSGILKNGLNYVVGLQNKFHRKLRRRGASVGSTLHGKDYPKVVIDDITYTREKVVGTGFTSPQGRKLFRSNDHVIW